MDKKLNSIILGFFKLFNKITMPMFGYEVVALVTERYPVRHIIWVAPHRFRTNVVDMDGFVDVTPRALASEPSKKLV